jgi:hypothetical protein
METINENMTEQQPPKYYTDKHREAQQKYREKNRDKYNVSQRELYMRLHQNEEWREMFNERSKKNNLIARQRKREQLLRTNPDIVIRGRGRPRKCLPLRDNDCVILSPAFLSQESLAPTF